MTSVRIRLKRKGGPGSGNWNHKGRPGMVGGSASSKGSLSTIKLSTATRSPVYSNKLPPMGFEGDPITPQIQGILEACTLRVLESTHVNLSRISYAVDDRMMPGGILAYHQPIRDAGKPVSIGVVTCTNKITGFGNKNIVAELARDSGIDNNFTAALKHSIMHELGHEAYIQLPGRLKQSWRSQYVASREFNSKYGKTDEIEGFCEMFAKYLNGYDVHPSISEWMDKNVRTTK